MKKRFVIFICLFILSCDSGIGPPLNHNTIPLIPLRVGNYWLYQNYLLDPNNGTITHPEYHNKDGFVINDSLSQTILGSSFMSYNISYCGEDLEPVDDSNYLPYGGSKLVHQDDDGLYYTGIVRKDTIISQFNDLIFPYPPVKSQSSSGHIFYYSTLGNYFSIPDDVIVQYTCVSTDSLFNTPLGEFRCIVYKTGYADFPPLFRDDVYYFIKPGLGIIGMVQMVYFYNTGEYNFMRKYILTDYKIK